MAVLQDPQKSADDEAKICAEDTEFEQEETEMHAYPADLNHCHRK
ncbi:MAG TPA: hypothetical protein VKL99_02260 [Candidatus Angelobacter sp.]|nr:hypothetical protein [Candidatus Angelobacter sp.]